MPSLYLPHDRKAVRIRLRWTGRFRIPPGTVTRIATPDNIPVRRRVRLHHQPSATIVREGWSDAVTGEHGHFLENLASGRYYLIAFDYTGQHGPVCESDIVAEPMP